MMKKIEKANLPALFAAITEEASLFLPVKNGGMTNFALWSEEAEVDLDTLKTVKSAKDAFFPQCETLYSCARKDGKMQITPGERMDETFVLFGVRACDVKGFTVLDNVFLSDPVDSFYKARRDHGIVVAMACHAPEESCFCGTFGIDGAEPGADVDTWMVGDELYWKANTEKGAALTERLSAYLSDAEENAVDAEKASIRSIMEKLPYASLTTEGWGADAQKEKFDSPLWEDLYKPCLACGTCTFVCPTCQCYDIKDYTGGETVQRYRCWDSCMYSDFTMMAHGNNRTSQMQRYRQRFMHKLVYYPANYGGEFSCVGCGRCVDKCPTGLNIVKVIKAFAKKEDK